MKKILVLTLSVLLILGLSGCAKEQKQEDKEKTTDLCVKKDTDYQLSFDEAEEIAKNSECLNQGELKETYFCNEYTGTWWLDLEVKEKPGCNPACVINVETKEAEINWRCTGLIMKE